MNHSELMTWYKPHCVKSVLIRSYFCSLFSSIWTEYRKIRTRNNSLFGHFSRSASFRTFVKYIKIWIKVVTFFITSATQKKKFSIKHFFRKCGKILNGKLHFFEVIIKSVKIDKIITIQFFLQSDTTFSSSDWSALDFLPTRMTSVL